MTAEEQLRYTLDFVDRHVHFGEAKNAAVFLAAGGTAVASATLYLGEEGLSLAISFYLALTWGQSVLAAVIAIVSFLPRTQLPWLEQLQPTHETDNLLFFGHVQKYSPDGYWAAVAAGNAGTASRLEMCLCEQIVINSRIASRKFTLFKYAAWTLLAAIVTPVGAWLLSLYIADPNH